MSKVRLLLVTGTIMLFTGCTPVDTLVTQYVANSLWQFVLQLLTQQAM